MKTRIGLYVAAASLALCLAASAGQPSPAKEQGVAFFRKPTAAIRRFKAPPRIDGRLDEAGWASATRLAPFRDFRTGKEAAVQTVALMGFDDANLYIAFRCREPELSKLKRAEIDHDAMGLFAVDHVELFLKTDPATDAYYQFAVDALGARYESSGEDASWNAKWTAASHVGKGEWSVEISIPFQAIAQKPPRFLLANFCRSRRVEPGETSCWSATFGLFHNPSRFGNIVLGEPSGISLEGAVVREVSRGTHSVTAQVKSTAQAGKAVAVSVHRKAGGVLAKAAQKRITVPPGRTTNESLALELEDSYSGPLVVTLRDARSGEVVWFAGPQSFSLRGKSGLKIATVLEQDASPALRWVETQRLRACCYGFGVRPLPKLPLKPLAREIKEGEARELALKGEVIVRVQVAEGEKLAFRLTGGKPSSLFSQSTYAVFDPDGRHLADGLVAPGENKDVALSVRRSGLHVVYLNSGPASDNAFRLRMGNSSWVIDGRGKGAYIGTLVSLNSLRDLSLAGFNTVLLGAWAWGFNFATDDGLNAWVAEVRLWAEAAERYDMRIIPYVGWACAKSEVTAAGDYRKTLSTREIDGPRPCPLSQKYWDRTFLRRALAVARLSKQHPSVMGVGLDPESYYFGAWYRKERERRKLKGAGWGSIVFFSNDECFCDRCFFGFLKSQGLKRPAVAADGRERSRWLKEEGLTQKHYTYLGDELCALTARLREKVHAVNPDLAFAVMLLGHGDHWWCRGVSRGLGTSRVPAFDYDETTYTPGFTPAVARHRARFRRWGAHVLHGGTLWGGKHPPQSPCFLSAQMYHFAVRDGGYWFWPGNSSLWRNPDKLRHYYVLAGRQEDYWKAFVRANREIDRKLGQGDRHPSELDTLRHPPPTPNLDRTPGKNAWSEKPFYPLRVKSGTTLSFYVPSATSRFTFLCGLREGAGEWNVVVASPARPISVRRLVSAEKGEEINIDVPPAARGKAWTVRVEKAGTNGSDYLGIGFRGLPPYISSAPSSLLVPSEP